MVDGSKIKEIVELRLQGKSFRDIQNLVTGLSKGSISKYLNKYHIGGKLDYLCKFMRVFEKSDLAKFLFIRFNKLGVVEKFDIESIDPSLYDKIKNEYEELSFNKIYNCDLDDKTKSDLQKRYDEIGSIKKLAKESHASYRALKTFIILKERKQTKLSRYDSIKLRRKELKSSLVEYKGGKCEICGYDRCIDALEFHHKDPDKKDFTISDSYTRKRDDVFNEVDKCILVCSNCHREIHSGIITI